MAFQGTLTLEQIHADPQQQIRAWQREHDFAVCIDTDGCVLDNMWAKQVLVFQSLFMDVFALRAAEMHFRIHGEHHNLWGKTRGCDRYVAIQHTLDSLLADPQAADSFSLDYVRRIKDSVDGYIASVTESDGARAFGTPSLIEYHQAHGRDFNITRLLAWSESVNRSFRYFTLSMPPFDGVRETLEWLAPRADIMVVSATPYCDLTEWWSGQDLTQHLQAIAGKEMGKKADHIRLLMESGGYAPEQVIMVGDGGGDLKAARANGVAFLPTPAGAEVQAWQDARETFATFMAAKYRGAVEDARVAQFDDILQADGPWQKPGYDARTEYARLQDKRVETYKALHPTGRLFTL